jgi:cell division protease FtsH
MSDQESPKIPRRRRKAPETPSNNWKGVFVFFILLAIILVSIVVHHEKQSNATDNLDFNQFVTLLENKQVKEVKLFAEPSTGVSYLSGKYLTNAEKPETSKGFKTNINLSYQKNLEDTLAKNGFPNVTTEYIDNQMLQALVSIVPFLLFIVLMYFLFRQQIRSAGKGAFSFGKSRAKLLSKDKNKVMFKDVAGIEEAREEVEEIVQFLKEPKKFQKLGARIPKGVLLVGPPGTGKTLLAKAIAGEADVPFYGISGSDFVEMFVGVGASRVRDMFEEGRKNAPCIIFIDEIDAVGRSRGHGVGGGHDEREQTLNAMLVEMDGIDSQEGVIIIAATNRKDVLDPALLRPGRFDREVRVHLPDIKGREAILKVHSRKVKLDKDVDLAIIARGTPGFSGAELENLINEAALLAARQDYKSVQLHHLEEARDKVRWGRERRSLAMSDEEKRITAYHEAGHALLNVVLENTDPLHKVTIIPRGPALGVTMMLPKQDRYGYERKKILDEICVIMGGRIAEDVFIGDISSGASGDIRQASWYARKMVCEWGMSKELGMVDYSSNDDYVFLGKDLGKNRPYSEQIAQKIDQEVLDITNTAYQKAQQLITKHKDQVELIAQALLEFETLDGSQIGQIIKEGKMTNPPSKPSAKAPVTEASTDKNDDEPLSGLEGAQAPA